MRLLILLFVISLSSCGNQKTIDKGCSDSSYTEIKLDFANNFKVYQFQDTFLIRVFTTSEMIDFTELKCHKGKLKVGNSNWVNIDKCITLSATQNGAICLLDQRERLIGVNSKSYVYDTVLRSMIDEGQIREFGDLYQFNKEVVLEAQPNIVFHSSMGGDQNNIQWYLENGIQFIPVTEWRESHVLGRAEWIKFYGYLFDEVEAANKIYSTARKNYEELSQNDKIYTTSVMLGNDFKGNWYTPGGNSFLCQILKQTGASYPWYDTDDTGSLVKDLEVMLLEQGNAEYWINPGVARTLGELKIENENYTKFKSFQEEKVFNNTKKSHPDGGSDYWETGLYFPDKLLSDYRGILSGDTVQWNKLNYYIQLK